MSGMEIRPLLPEDYGPVSRMCARAFERDPVWRHLFPDSRRRPRQLAWIFECWARIMGPMGTSYVAGDCVGTAMWFPPERGPHAGFAAQVAAGLWRAPWTLGPGFLWRGARIQHDMNRLHRAELDSPCWILDVLAVDPDCHRQGVGTALVGHMLERADRERTPCYVITHNPDNIAYYERHGFRLLHRAARGYLANSLRRGAPA